MGEQAHAVKRQRWRQLQRQRQWRRQAGGSTAVTGPSAALQAPSAAGEVSAWPFSAPSGGSPLEGWPSVSPSRAVARGKASCEVEGEGLHAEGCTWERRRQHAAPPAASTASAPNPERNPYLSLADSASAHGQQSALRGPSLQEPADQRRRGRPTPNPPRVCLSRLLGAAYTGRYRRTSCRRHRLLLPLPGAAALTRARPQSCPCLHWRLAAAQQSSP